MIRSLASDTANGVQTHQGTVSPGLHGILFKVAMKVECEKPPAPKPKGKGRPIKIADEVVLEIRRLHEREGWSFRKIRTAYPDIKPDTIRQFIDYQTRCNLRLPRL